MDAVAPEPMQVLQAQISRAREKLNALSRDLQTVDGELGAIGREREQYALLEQACSSLEKLSELGATALFAGERLPQAALLDHVRDVRGRAAQFHERLGKIEARRQQIFEHIARVQDAVEILEDDLYEEEQQEERRKLEWIVERDVDPSVQRAQRLPWARGGEEDWRFRKTLASALLAALLLGSLLPLIDLPLPTRDEVTEIPEHLVALIEERARIVPPEPPPQERPEETKPDRKTEPKPTDQPKQLAAAQQPQSQPKAEQMGILAFREKFSALRQSTLTPRLGRQARISSADDDSAGRPQRSMLTTNAPGSSGGINLAGISRDVGGGGGGELEGVALTRASSGINAVGPGERPLSSGPGPSRTDEEIQIVFDRYKAALYRLYNRELRKDPTLQGQMVLRLTIEPDGSVSVCQLQSTDMSAPDLVAQILDRVRTFNFGAKQVPAITIVYPIDFLPAA